MRPRLEGPAPRPVRRPILIAWPVRVGERAGGVEHRQSITKSSIIEQRMSGAEPPTGAME